jgi:hypothetical protein
VGRQTAATTRHQDDLIVPDSAGGDNQPIALREVVQSWADIYRKQVERAEFRKFIREQATRSYRHSDVLVVSGTLVYEDDTIRGIRQVVQADMGDTTCAVVQGQASDDQVPPIIGLVGKRRFVAAARRSGVSRVRTKRWIAMVAGLAALVIFGVILAVLQMVLKALSPTAGDAASSYVSPTLLGLAALIVIIGITTSKIKLPNLLLTNDALRELSSDITKNTTHPKFDDFIVSLSDLLRPTGAGRIVLVDRYGELDDITTRVIITYLESAPSRLQDDRWIIFDGDAASFAKLCVTEERKQLPRYLRAKRYHVVDGSGRLSRLTKDELVAPAVEPGAGPLHGRLTALVKAHPQSLGFRVLYLIAVDARSGSYTHRRSSLAGRLAEDRTSRPVSLLLDASLGLPKPTKREAVAALGFRDSSNSPLRACLDDDLGRDELRLRADAVECIIAVGEAEGLPQPAIVHAYWSILWWNQQRNKPLNAFWALKLGRNLAAADLVDASGDRTEEQTLLDALFEATLYALEANLRTACLDHVPQIAQLGASLIDTENDAKWSQKVRRLTTQLWTAYALTGDDNVLGDVLTIAALHDSPATTSFEDLSDVEQLYVATTNAVDDGQVDHLATAVTRADPSVRTFVQLRGGWLAQQILKTFRLSYWPIQAASLTKLRGTASYISTVDAIVDRLQAATTAFADVLETEPANADSESPTPDGPASYIVGSMLLDLQSLVLALWLARPDARQRTLAHLLEAARSMDQNLPRDDVLEQLDALGYVDWIGTPDAEVDFIDRLHLAILAAAVLRDTFESVRMKDFLVRPLIWQTCDELLALAALESPEAYREASNVLAVDQEAGDQSPGPVGKLELQRLAGNVIMWRTLGFARLEMVARVRLASLQLDRPSTAGSTREAVESLSPAFEDRGHLGLIACLLVANTAGEGRDVRAIFVERGVQAVLAEPRPGSLPVAMVLLALGYGWARDDTTPLILDELGRRPAEYRRELEVVPDDAIPTLAMRITDVANRIGPSGQALVDLIGGRLTTMSDARSVDLVERQLDLWRFRRDLAARQTLDQDSIFAHWAGRHDSHHWSEVLDLMLDRTRADSTDPAIVLESVHALREAEPVDNTVYIHLAVNVLDHVDPRVQPALHQEVASFLREHIYGFSTLLSAEMNSQAFGELKSAFPHERERFEGEQKRWNSHRLYRDSLRRLPEMLQQGRYFALFSYFANILSSWDLPFTGEQEVLAVPKGAEGARQLIDEWMQDPGPQFQPIMGPAHARTVNYRFLRTGRCLWEPPIDAQEVHDTDRRRFDELARAGLDDLMAMTVKVPGLPDDMRKVFREYANRFANTGSS